MSLNIYIPEKRHLKPEIKVVGVGGAGGNAVNNMINSGLKGVTFTVANTDAQALANSLCENRIQLGEDIAKGLGAGSSPDIGKAAAEESMNEIIENIKDSNMIFIAAGIGGGTGTGAAPVIARIAREHNILTVAVVTKPFNFEGKHRNKIAELGIAELEKHVDTLIVIPNQNLFYQANNKTTFADAFKMVDHVLLSGVRSITDLMTIPGIINLDFADIKTVMGEMGRAMMGNGEATGEDRAIKAAEEAISNPLLDNTSMRGARGVIINITGGDDLTLFEVDEAANRIKQEVDDNDARIIFGSACDPSMSGKIRVSVVATGMQGSGNNYAGQDYNNVEHNYAKKDKESVEATGLNLSQKEASKDGLHLGSDSNFVPEFRPPEIVVPRGEYNPYDQGRSNDYSTHVEGKNHNHNDNFSPKSHHQEPVEEGNKNYEDDDVNFLGNNSQRDNSENTLFIRKSEQEQFSNRIDNDVYGDEQENNRSNYYEDDNSKSVSSKKEGSKLGNLFSLFSKDSGKSKQREVSEEDDFQDRKAIDDREKISKAHNNGSNAFSKIIPSSPLEIQDDIFASPSFLRSNNSKKNDYNED